MRRKFIIEIDTRDDVDPEYIASAIALALQNSDAEGLNYCADPTDLTVKPK